MSGNKIIKWIRLLFAAAVMLLLQNCESGKSPNNVVDEPAERGTIVINNLEDDEIIGDAVRGSVIIDADDVPVPVADATVDVLFEFTNISTDTVMVQRRFILVTPTGAVRTAIPPDTTMLPQSTQQFPKQIFIAATDPSGTYTVILRWSSGSQVLQKTRAFRKLGTVGSSPLDTLALAYHDFGYENEVGCGGANICELAVRFTPVTYPCKIIEISVTQQGSANSALTLNTYLDPDALIAGPSDEPVYTSASFGGRPGVYTETIASPISVTAGDFYIGIVELSGYAGLGMDLQNQALYVDRSWASVDGGQTYDLLFDLVGGDPALYGNIAITATIMTKNGQLMTIRPESVREAR